MREHEWRRYQRKPTLTKACRLRVATEVETPNGKVVGAPGDWLLEDADGRLYPCVDSVFRKTYEPFEETQREALLRAWAEDDYFEVARVLDAADPDPDFGFSDESISDSLCLRMREWVMVRRELETAQRKLGATNDYVAEAVTDEEGYRCDERSLFGEGGPFAGERE